ncbi:MAG: hypothetical protein Q9198_010159 [Flavoplaca austrocitrina]
MAPNRLPNKLLMIYGGQRRDQPRSKLQVERNADFKRSRRGVKAKTQGPQQTPPATVDDGGNVQQHKMQAGAVAPSHARGTGLARSSASMMADGPAAQDQSARVVVAQKRKAAPDTTQMRALPEGTRKSARIANKELKSSGETSNQATGRGKGKKDIDSVRLEHLEQVQREAQAEHDAVVMSGNAGVEKAFRAVDKAVRAAAAASERTGQKLESAKAATAQQHIVVQKKLAQLLGGDAENTDDDDSDVSE